MPQLNDKKIPGFLSLTLGIIIACLIPLAAILETFKPNVSQSIFQEKHFYGKSFLRYLLDYPVGGVNSYKITHILAHKTMSYFSNSPTLFDKFIFFFLLLLIGSLVIFVKNLIV